MNVELFVLLHSDGSRRCGESCGWGRTFSSEPVEDASGVDKVVENLFIGDSHSMMRLSQKGKLPHNAKVGRSETEVILGTGGSG